MPSKSLGLFPASLSTDPLFCLEFVEITNKIETAGDLKARERKGVAVGKDKYIVGFHMTSLKIQSKKLSILPRFYFHDTLEQLKTNFHTNFRFKRVLGLVIEYA